MANAAPIFIAGCGRSGTTYLQTIVDTHPNVFLPTETLFIPQYLKNAQYVPKGILKWLFYREPHLRAWYDGPSTPIDEMAQTIATVHKFAAAQEGKTIWGQKTPRFVRHIDLFRKSFPGCRWILIYRDPRATVASMLNSPVHPFSIAWAADRWNLDNQPVIEHLKNPRPDTLVISYEQLIRDFDNHLKRVFNFLGLEQVERADFEQHGKVRNFKGTTFSIQANNVRDGLAPNPNSINSWKKSLSEGQVREIERRCAATMQQLGYEPLPAGPTGLKVRSMEPLRSAWSRVQNLGILARYLRHWPHFLVHHALRTAIFTLFRALGRTNSSGDAVPRGAANAS